MNFFEARKRNVIFKITKVCLEKNLLKKDISKDTLKEIFYLKERDVKGYLDVIFEKINDEKYKIKSQYIEEISGYLDKNKLYKSKQVLLKEELIKQYEKLNECMMNIRLDNEKLSRIINETVDIAEKLHYIYLPIYSENIIKNTGKLPEEDLKDYYNNYHTIQDLYFEVTGKGIDYKSTGGDCNLEKEFTVKVYSGRWGHDDNYGIKRTIDGWHLSFLAYTGQFHKNGKGKFFESLEHDGIVFPKEGVEYALEILWAEADNTEMKINELKHKFEQVINWINEVEKATKKFQPDWCNYF